jgi:hypothetical protein
MNGSGRRAAPYLLFAALVAAVYADPLFLPRVFTGRDLIAYNIPMEKSVHDGWASGDLPAWTPEISGGRPLAPNPNVGAFYPLRILFSRLPFPTLLRLAPVLHWTAAGIGMLLLLSSLGVSREGAWLGAVTYVFGGVSVSECFYPHIQPGMTLLPWILWQLRRGRGIRGTVGLSLLFALDMLAADVFTIAVAIVCAALWAALEEEPAGAQALVRTAGAVVLGALAAAPQILATALWIPETNRGVLGMKLSNAILYSITPWRLVELVVPYPFGPVWRLDAWELWGGPVHNWRGMGLFETLYAGILPLVAVVTLWRSKAAGLRFARALLLLALAVAVVPSLLPLSWGNWKSPLPLRNPEKFAVALALALAMFGARGFDEYVRRKRPRGMLAIAMGLTILALTAAVQPWAAGRFASHLISGDNPFADRAAASLPFALATAALLWTATLIALDVARRPRGRLAAVALLTCVPIAANRPIARTAPEISALGPTAFARLVTKADPEGSYRTLGAEIYQPPATPRSTRYGDSWEIARQDWVHDTSLLWGRGVVFNYDFDEGDLARVESLRKLSGFASAFPDAGSFFGTFSLRWCVRQPEQKPLPGYRRFGGTPAQDWDQHERPFRDVRLATSWREEVGAVEAASRIGQIPPGGLVLETGRRREGTAAPGRVEVLRRTPTRLEITADAPEATWLFVLRAYWDYRVVRLDGAEVETVPANLAFTAVPIPAGRHRVDWHEEVPAWSVSRFGLLVYGIVVLSVFALPRARASAP